MAQKGEGGGVESNGAIKFDIGGGGVKEWSDGVESGGGRVKSNGVVESKVMNF